MSDTTHAPGPWHAFQGGDKGSFEITHANGNGGSTTVAFTPYGGDGNRHWANAQLISAAPEMLEALKEVVEWVGKETAPLDQMPDAMVALLLAREAIEKAEGGAS